MEQLIDKKNTNLVVVESNIVLAKLIEKLLGKLYNVHIYDSPEKAFYQLERELKPFCVISTYQFKKMKGDQFLRTVENINKDIVCILLTSVSSTKEIVEIIRSSHATFYIKKPFDNLNLLQTIRAASNIFELRIKNNLLSRVQSNFNEKYHTLKDKLNNQNEESKSEFKSILRAISSLIIKAEKFHFRPHTSSVSAIAKALAKNLGFQEESINKLFYVSLIINHYKIGLPDRYKLYDPRYISNEAEKVVFTNHFKESLTNIINLPSLKEIGEYAGKIFESLDGKGFPAGLQGIDIPREVQILNIVNTYYHNVYTVLPDDLVILKSEGYLTQSLAETKKRHKDSITLLYKNLKCYEHDLFYAFQDMLKKHELPELSFQNKDLEITYDNHAYGSPSNDEEENRSIIEQIALRENSVIEVKDQNDELIETYIKKKVRSDDLKQGQLLLDDVKNDSGVKLFKKGTVLDQEQVEKLIKYIDKGVVPNKLYIKLEFEEEDN